jgi:hypothetical protein
VHHRLREEIYLKYVYSGLAGHRSCFAHSGYDQIIRSRPFLRA